MLIHILILTVLYDTTGRRYNKEHVHIFLAKDITKKLTLVCK